VNPGGRGGNLLLPRRPRKHPDPFERLFFENWEWEGERIEKDGRESRGDEKKKQPKSS